MLPAEDDDLVAVAQLEPAAVAADAGFLACALGLLALMPVQAERGRQRHAQEDEPGVDSYAGLAALAMALQKPTFLRLAVAAVLDEAA